RIASAALAKVAASGLASFRSWLAATQYFNPHERRFGSFATDAAGLSYQLMSASLIGRSGSSTFRLSAAAVSMSLTGSRFSSESAPRPFHYGIRGRGGTIYQAALSLCERQVQATKRTHLIHRPARDIIPPLGGARVFSYRI